MSDLPVCPYCRSAVSFKVASCAACHRRLPWSLGLEFFEDDQRAEAAIKELPQQVINLTHQFLDRAITSEQWQKALQLSIVRLHFAHTALARNRQYLNVATWNCLWGIISAQFKRLAQLAQEYASHEGFVAQSQVAQSRENADGTHPLMQKISTLINAGRSTYENMKLWQAAEQGHIEARRVLSDEPCCEGCINEAQKGWIPIASMLPIGRTEVGDECTCVIITRRTQRAFMTDAQMDALVAAALEKQRAEERQ